MHSDVVQHAVDLFVARCTPHEGHIGCQSTQFWIAHLGHWRCISQQTVSIREDWEVGAANVASIIFDICSRSRGGGRALIEAEQEPKCYAGLGDEVFLNILETNCLRSAPWSPSRGLVNDVIFAVEVPDAHILTTLINHHEVGDHIALLGTGGL